MTREEFGGRYRETFMDPAFDGERAAIGRLEQIAWQAYEEGRKAPVTRPIGPGAADPRLSTKPVRIPRPGFAIPCSGRRR